MGRVTRAIHQFNGGVGSKRLLGRTDQETTLKIAAEQENFLPMPIGAMQARPGFERKGTGNSQTKFWQFKRGDEAGEAVDDDMLELRSDGLRVITGGARVTRATQTMSITEGEFDNSLAGWTTATPGSSAIASTGDNLVMTASGDDNPTATQEITVAAGTHAAKIVVTRGPVLFRVGSTSGDDDIFGSGAAGLLDTGEHQLQWTSSGSSFFIQFSAEDSSVQRIVDSISVATAGEMVVTTPWSGADLASLRFMQIGDVVFVGSTTRNYQARKIERRSGDSWSVVLYENQNGPFLTVFEHAETMQLAATTGNTTLTSSSDYFRSAHVGALFQLTHNTQSVSDSFSANGATSEYVRITGGANDDRTVDYSIDFSTGSFVGTIVLERAFGDPVSYNSWQTHANGGGDIDTTIDETNDDRVAFVRLRVTAYTSGTAAVTLFAPQGETLGVVRVTGYTSATEVDVEVLTQAGDVTAVQNWREGQWSDVQGWPAVPMDDDGRVWWFGADSVNATESDDLYDFDEEIEGDSAPINRRLGGQVKSVQWALPLDPWVVGTTAQEHSANASDLTEKLTRESISIKSFSGWGSANIQAVPLGDTGLFIDKDQLRPWLIAPHPNKKGWKPVRLDFFIEHVFPSKIVEIAVQHRPHTRIYFRLDNGELWGMLYEPEENIRAYYKITSIGFTFKAIGVQSVAAQPSDRLWVVVEDEDENAILWRMFPEEEALGGSLNKMCDDAVVYESLGSDTLTGLTHIAGRFPALWIDGKQIRSENQTGTVNSSGEYTHTATITNAVAGRPYSCRYRSAKLAHGAQAGSALAHRRTIHGCGMLFTDTCLDGVLIGVVDGDQEFSDPHSRIVRNEEAEPGKLWSELEETLRDMKGSTDNDPRLLIENIAPNPCTVIGAVLDVETVEG